MVRDHKRKTIELICPKCNKPAFRRQCTNSVDVDEQFFPFYLFTSLSCDCTRLRAESERQWEL